jgi:hypothetical protein
MASLCSQSQLTLRYSSPASPHYPLVPSVLRPLCECGWPSWPVLCSRKQAGSALPKPCILAFTETSHSDRSVAPLMEGTLTLYPSPRWRLLSSTFHLIGACIIGHPTHSLPYERTDHSCCCPRVLPCPPTAIPHSTQATHPEVGHFRGSTTSRATR